MNAVELFAALGHESRLAIFRLLVEAGPDGVHASAIGAQLDIPAATLSFHLAHLSRVGLIRGERESRFIRYAAAYDTTDDLIAFLTHNCCQGKACLPKTRQSTRVRSAKVAAKFGGKAGGKAAAKTPIKTRSAKDKA